MPEEGSRLRAYLIADACAIPVAPPVSMTALYERTPLSAGARKCVLATRSAPDARISCILALDANVARCSGEALVAKAGRVAQAPAMP